MDTISLYKHTRKLLLEFTEYGNKIKINNVKRNARIMKSLFGNYHHHNSIQKHQ